MRHSDKLYIEFIFAPLCFTYLGTKSGRGHNTLNLLFIPVFLSLPPFSLHSQYVIGNLAETPHAASLMWSFKHRPDANTKPTWTRPSPPSRALLECSVDSYRIFIFENWHTRHFPQQKRNQQHLICSSRKHPRDDASVTHWVTADHKTLGSRVKISGFNQKYIDWIWINSTESARPSTG